MSAPTFRATALPTLLASAALGLSGCFGGEEDKGFVESYSPAYLEAKGTAHAGDFFPLKPGTENITGAMTGSANISVSGKVQGQPVDETQTLPVNEDLSSEVVTGAPVSMAFPKGGTFTVIPQSSTSFDSEEGFETTTAYFQKAAEAVYMRGIGGSAGQISEPATPVYLKLPLTVGDSWESAAADVVDVTDGATGETKVRARTFVVGMEQITVGGVQVKALRLDQVMEMEGTMSEDGMNMKMSGQFTLIMHLVENRGMVRQAIKGSMKVSSNMANGDDRINMNGTTTMQGTMESSQALAKTAAPRSVPVPVWTRLPAQTRGTATAAFGASNAVWRKALLKGF